MGGFNLGNPHRPRGPGQPQQFTSSPTDPANSATISLLFFSPLTSPPSGPRRQLSGNWTVLFDALEDHSVDLLANEITDDWHWDKWPFTPRIADELEPYRTHIYMPIIRYSK